MQHVDLIQRLYQIGAIQFGEFKLKSGQLSSVYINLRKIISYPDLLRNIAQAMWQLLKDKQSQDLVCGVPYTALPIATCLSLDQNLAMIMRRKEKKDYGTKQSIEGEFKAGQRCLVIEDVITTGGSILETVADLKEQGLIVSDVIALIDRQQGGRQTLEQAFQVHTLLNLNDILTYLRTSSLLTTAEHQAIDKFINGVA